MLDASKSPLCSIKLHAHCPPNVVRTPVQLKFANRGNKGPKKESKKEKLYQFYYVVILRDGTKLPPMCVARENRTWVIPAWKEVDGCINSLKTGGSRNPGLSTQGGCITNQDHRGCSPQDTAANMSYGDQNTISFPSFSFSLFAARNQGSGLSHVSFHFSVFVGFFFLVQLGPLARVHVDIDDWCQSA